MSDVFLRAARYATEAAHRTDQISVTNMPKQCSNQTLLRMRGGQTPPPQARIESLSVCIKKTPTKPQ